jgi:diguanylate cyclase (GGDEF)-like protein
MIYLVLIIGVLSSFALIYFYLKQKEFSETYKEFLTAMYNLENSQGNLNYLILQNSVYAYHNHDLISQKQKEIMSAFTTLEHSKLLEDKRYETIHNSLETLSSQLNEKNEKIEKYLMLNAGVKNSLLFLTRHVDNASKSVRTNQCTQECRETFLEASTILKHYNNATQMQDLDYINNANLLLSHTSQEQKNSDFIESFNLHAAFLIKQYPQYIAITKSIFDTQLSTTLNQIREDFSTLTLNDFEALNAFNIILFTIFLLFIATITFLFFIYIRENKKLLATKESLEYSLIYDQLTKLYNRTSLEQKLKQIQKPHILLINIDNFKNINDIYGNALGNELLKKLARLLEIKLAKIPNAGIYRLGGDEFGVLFSDIENSKALNIAYILEKEIASHSFVFDDLEIHITVAISSNNIWPILENADLVLKVLKKDVTKSVIEYKESLNLKKSVQENLQMVETLKTAIMEDRIVPHFQPIVNLQTLKIEKYESLVRLMLPDGQYLAPYKFLEIAKKSSLYEELTRIMIEKSMQVAKKYPQYRFSINISMRDILNVNLTNMLFQLFDAEKEVASRIDIEFLESEDLNNVEKTQQFIEKVHSYGSKILIDDFGSGYSNFAYFANLEIDSVKIDGSIVSEITSNERKLHMLRSIHQFAHGMELLDIAEFVETKEIALLLRETGVTYAQGYYFSKPLCAPLESDTLTLS